MSHLPPTDTKFKGTERLTNLTALAAGTIDLSAATTVSAPTVAGTLDSTTKVATTAFVQAVAAVVQTQIDAFDYKPSVRVATTGALTITARTIQQLTIGGVALTIDGVVLANGDRVLVKDATAGVAGAGTADNGIFAVAGIGAAVVLNRATDVDTWGEVPGHVMSVEVGTANADKAFMCIADSGGTLGTTAITYNQFGAGTAYSGTTNRVTVTGSVIDISSAYVGQASITTLGTVTAGVWNGTAIPIANGGTGAVTAAAAILALGGVDLATTQTIGGSKTISALAGVTAASGTIALAGAADVTVPTAAAGDNDTSAASTAFVQKERRTRTVATVVHASFPYTLTATSLIPSADMVMCQQTAAVAMTLCAANAVPAGCEITVKDISATGAYTNNITINRAGTDTIDGLTTATIDTSLQALTFVSNGVGAWYIV